MGVGGGGITGCGINQNPKLVKTRVLLCSRMDSSLPSSPNQTSGLPQSLILVFSKADSSRISSQVETEILVSVVIIGVDAFHPHITKIIRFICK